MAKFTAPNGLGRTPAFPPPGGRWSVAWEGCVAAAPSAARGAMESHLNIEYLGVETGAGIDSVHLIVGVPMPSRNDAMGPVVLARSACAKLRRSLVTGLELARASLTP